MSSNSNQRNTTIPDIADNDSGGDYGLDNDLSVAKGNQNTSLKPSGPRFMSVPMGEQARHLTRSGQQGTPLYPDNIIDATFYLDSKPPAKTNGTEDKKSRTSNWCPTKLCPVPAYYPIENSSRLVDDPLSDILSRISECLRVLSIKAIYNNDTATAFLTTLENVEMYLSLRTFHKPGQEEAKDNNNNMILVELQRRKGDSITFHRYSRNILDAVVGDVNVDDYEEMYKGSQNNHDKFARQHSKKLERLLLLHPNNKNNTVQLQDEEETLHIRKSIESKATEFENSIIAIEIAHDLLLKDRVDAQQLGLESLCLLTDPFKTGLTTAILASHVILLGTIKHCYGHSAGTYEKEDDDNTNMMFNECPFEEIHQKVLSLVLCASEDDDDDGFSLSSSEEFAKNEFASSRVDGNYYDYKDVLHNLAMAVLANALDIIEHDEDKLVADLREPEETNTTNLAASGSRPRRSSASASFFASTLDEHEEEEEWVNVRNRARAASESSVMSSSSPAYITDLFIHDKEGSDILSILIQELSKADQEPHNAHLSARCLGSLCRASHQAKRKAIDLGAKQVIRTAIEVGSKYHFKLETECKKVETTLLVQNNDPDSAEIHRN